MLDYATLYYAGHVLLLFAASLFVGKLAGPVVTRILEMLSSKTQSTLDDRIIAAVKMPIETFFFLIVFYFLLHQSPELVATAAFLDRYTTAILVLIATFMLSEASGAAIRWYYEEGHVDKIGKRLQKLGVDNSLLPLVRKVSKLAIYIVGFTIAVSQAGFDITGVLTVTSIAAVILGLASQETLGNIFAGIALQMDRPYHYGDYLRLPGGEIATVKKIGMRSTKLEDLQHNTIVVSNSEFAKMRVTNLSLPDDESEVYVQAELPSGADLEKLEARLSSVLLREKPRGLRPEKGFRLIIDAVKPSTVLVSFAFWIKGYENAPAIREMVNRAMLSFIQGKK